MSDSSSEEADFLVDLDISLEQCQSDDSDSDAEASASGNSSVSTEFYEAGTDEEISDDDEDFNPIKCFDEKTKEPENDNSGYIAESALKSLESPIVTLELQKLSLSKTNVTTRRRRKPKNSKFTKETFNDICDSFSKKLSLLSTSQPNINMDDNSDTDEFDSFVSAKSCFLSDSNDSISEPASVDDNDVLKKQNLIIIDSYESSVDDDDVLEVNISKKQNVIIIDSSSDDENDYVDDTSSSHISYDDDSKTLDSDEEFVPEESDTSSSHISYDDNSAGSKTLDSDEEWTCDDSRPLPNLEEERKKIESDTSSSHISYDDNSAGSKTLDSDEEWTCDDSRPLPNLEEERKKMVKILLEKFNQVVFSNKLPKDLEVTWNKRLRSTAGLTYTKIFQSKRVARIELSSKVVDTRFRLQSTLLHECCHVAAWIVQGAAKPPHGPHFKYWANIGTKMFPDTPVTTLHTYAIHKKYRYECEGCGASFARHSKSIDLNRKVCGTCRGRIILLGNFNRDGTQLKAKKASGFSLFVKEHYKVIRKEHTSHKETMLAISEKWKARG